MGERRGKEVLMYEYIKDWFKPVFPLFLTWLFDSTLNTHVGFARHQRY